MNGFWFHRFSSTPSGHVTRERV
ncbi:hypothetical protein RB2654_15150 [Rhodobacterales bacterium HTCC2654]|uniref:Uncharacterized protein n=1 Tax=Maritimibacter alkaliphilus HTCC2654 TaxID=314271 RepID=A3VH79_9RHOB|nr:hypothetical protein RB2654_15150 [Rhodobacterales bacterium HTCC2654] [Maritimibacter alkaliphilus HTCC2654]